MFYACFFFFLHNWNYTTCNMSFSSHLHLNLIGAVLGIARKLSEGYEDQGSCKIFSPLNKSTPKNSWLLALIKLTNCLLSRASTFKNFVAWGQNKWCTQDSCNLLRINIFFKALFLLGWRQFRIYAQVMCLLTHKLLQLCTIKLGRILPLEPWLRGGSTKMA